MSTATRADADVCFLRHPLDDCLVKKCLLPSLAGKCSKHAAADSGQSALCT